MPYYFLVRWVLTMADAFRLFCDHNSFLACSDSGFVRRVLKCLVPTNWREGAINGGSVVVIVLWSRAGY